MATIECIVGNDVIMHFRNHDTRTGKSVHERVHSLHTHENVPANHRQKKEGILNTKGRGNTHDVSHS